jgi:hypothetical protein
LLVEVRELLEDLNQVVRHRDSLRNLGHLLPEHL